MNASGWSLLFRRRAAWAAVGVALVFFATAVIVKAGEAKSAKRRAVTAKAAAKARNCCGKFRRPRDEILRYRI